MAMDLGGEDPGEGTLDGGALEGDLRVEGGDPDADEPEGSPGEEDPATGDDGGCGCAIL